MSRLRRVFASSLVFGLLVSLGTVVGRGLGQPSPGRATLEVTARQAVDPDPAVAEAAIGRLRDLGPEGLARLVAVHRSALARLRESPPLVADPEVERLRHAVDRVSGQRDGHASGLYFHDDLSRALEEARRRNVPVLSLRLLGRLDEELSCANSRYFRTILYPDEALGERLRDHFVLHVQSERPAPRITIDMGDGRTMTRTITGNSVHYVLDAEGRVIDAIPGLYAAPQFLRALDAALALFDSCDRPSVAEGRACLAAAHRRAGEALEREWNARRAVDASLPAFEALVASRPGAPRLDEAVSARRAMPLTISKLAVEGDMLDAIAPVPTPRAPEPLDFRALNLGTVAPLGPSSLALLRLKTGQRDVSALAATLARNATADGLRNEFVMHRVVHEWLADPAVPNDYASINRRIYTELFLTPASDPWLGLRAPDVWDAVEELR